MGAEQDVDCIVRIEISACCGADVKRAFWGARICSECRSEVDKAGCPDGSVTLHE